ncbi:MAG: class II glutamine amidotransferase [Alphaproteobacteria bacterium]|nr:class II glutamine amidotransferase [Alphaproteobacteria bacterium]
MCRLFGFRSVLQSQVHRSLASADNALATQSVAHPDGWGVAYYVAGAPHIIKGTGQAHGDTIFHRVSGIVTSQTVLAHIRKATQGQITTLNCHPFQYGHWVMAHNGDVPGFAAHRDALVGRISPVLRRFLLGQTDSEVIFHLFLSALSEEVELHRRGAPVDAVVRALRAAVSTVHEISGDADRAPLLTLMVTDGEAMAAHQGGKELHYSTWKVRCAERDLCPHFSAECEAASTSGYVNHLIVSSEPLHGENVWLEMQPGEIVGVDHAMRLHRYGPGETPQRR